MPLSIFNFGSSLEIYLVKRWDDLADEFILWLKINFNPQATLHSLNGHYETSLSKEAS